LIKFPGKAEFQSLQTVLSKTKTITLQSAARLENNNPDLRCWLLDGLNCVNNIQHNEFMLDEVYQYGMKLKNPHQSNNNIRAKIRQQLQILRDAGITEFKGRGCYKKVQTAKLK